ncbi:HTH domain-containing protein [Halarchaeum salinum]|uniref:HTH domain-containing protein n=1 Tax=Halarchaeum salinum TaxID=489912 RepID=UPI003CD0C2D1
MHGNRKVSDERLLQQIESASGPFATATELSEQLSITRQAITDRLHALEQTGQVKSKRCGSGIGWWVVDNGP